MAEYDFNMIKPVDGLQNVNGIAPARRREERKRRKQLKNHDENKRESINEEIEEDIVSDDRQQNWSEDENNPNSNQVDFRA